jgi:hypothetical protein
MRLLKLLGSSVRQWDLSAPMLLFADHMAPLSRRWPSNEVQRYTDGQLKWIIHDRIWPSGMAGSKDTLSDDEIWSIARHAADLRGSARRKVTIN